MKTEASSQLTLYTYWRSSAAFRVRCALNLKGLAYQSIPVHLVRQGGEQHSESFRAINPQGLVPVLLHRGQVLTQSMAICEYLDECFEHYPLLPDTPVARARVRSLALQIACEIHPLNNLRVQKYLEKQCGDTPGTTEWMLHWMNEGFTRIEQQLSIRDAQDIGAQDLRVQDLRYNADRPGLLECFLVPQVYNAERYGLDMSAFSTINEIATRCRKLPAFIKAAPENQPDAIPS